MRYYTEVKINELHLHTSTWVNVINVTFTMLKVSSRRNYSICIRFKNEKIQQLGKNTNVAKTSFIKSQGNNKYNVLSWLLGGWREVN